MNALKEFKEWCERHWGELILALHGCEFLAIVLIVVWIKLKK
jgi:hypothetical protein